MPNRNELDNITITLVGSAGQGLQSVEQLLVKIIKKSQLNVFATKEYMSRVRGGANSTQIRIASKKIAAPRKNPDIIVILEKETLEHIRSKITKDVLVIGEGLNLKQETYSEIPFTNIAADIGGPIYANTLAVGIICGITGIDKDIAITLIQEYFIKKQDTIPNNLKAIEQGYILGKELVQKYKLNIKIKKDKEVQDEIIVNGSEAIALGAIAAGCNFLAAYPMTPSTGVFTFICEQAKEFQIVVEQAEDEIAAINMGIGASYAGARALANSSGGGFALMTEGISLAGMLEIPIVIHLAQRPGPATGLPTRTEQGDIELALYSGHGEFPRIIFAPGTLTQAFELTQKAFNLADEYQIPIFILSDQNFNDSYHNTKKFNTNIKNTKNIIKTEETYKRYTLTNNGISPRGVPNFGSGLVVADSDEHDEEGHITEDLELRKKMVDKRLKKLEKIKEQAKAPELIGNTDYETLAICYGSNYHIVKEAIENLNKNNKKIAMLHFSQIYPINQNAKAYIKKAKKIMMIENNATAQFAKLLKLQLDIDMTEKILKYDGLPFYVEEIQERLND